MRLSLPLTLTTGVMLCACQPTTARTITTPIENQDLRIQRILRQVPLTDGHNDLPWKSREEARLDFEDFDLTKRNDSGHTDIPRLREGGVGAQFWSVYVPVKMQGDMAVRATLEQMDFVRRMIDRFPNVFEYARGPEDAMRIFRSGRIASMMGVEGGHQTGGSIGVLRQLHRLGAHYMTLAHMANSPFADSATDAPQHGGLSEKGKEAVREMNRLGMLVDLSHVSIEAMHQGLDVSRAPVIFSHSSARAITDHPRNVPDEILKRLPKEGGVVMITFVPSYVSRSAGDWGLRNLAEQAKLAKKFGSKTDPRIENAMRVWTIKNPRPTAVLDDVVAHIEHVAKVAGHDHVGLGGDFDGISAVVKGLEDVSTYPGLLAALARRGWSDENLRKLCGENLMNVWRAADRIARSSR